MTLKPLSEYCRNNDCARPYFIRYPLAQGVKHFAKRFSAA
jgi:hypothetical protein